ncbi:MAG: radical SAM protein [Gammaproteobacteria bacterium]|nr:radical SAM protein [Gammaproteobacteria bacterium]
MTNQTNTYIIDDKLYLNITDRCTLNCTFCPKNNGSRYVHNYDLSLHHRPTAKELIDEIADPQQYNEIVFCGYGEPTLRIKVLLIVAEYVKSHNVRVRLNTDGLANLVHRRDILPEIIHCIDALSVSMNASGPDTYNKLCQPALANSFFAMLSFVKAAREYIPDVTVTAINGLPGVNISACEQLAKQLGVKFRARQSGIVG